MTCGQAVGGEVPEQRPQPVVKVEGICAAEHDQAVDPRELVDRKRLLRFLGTAIEHGALPRPPSQRAKRAHERGQDKSPEHEQVDTDEQRPLPGERNGEHEQQGGHQGRPDDNPDRGPPQAASSASAAASSACSA
jgi:hypothetical protein